MLIFCGFICYIIHDKIFYRKNNAWMAFIESNTYNWYIFISLPLLELLKIEDISCRRFLMFLFEASIKIIYKNKMPQYPKGIFFYLGTRSSFIFWKSEELCSSLLLIMLEPILVMYLSSLIFLSVFFYLPPLQIQILKVCTDTILLLQICKY